MAHPFLSRQFIGELPSSITAVPFAPGAPDQSGASVTHNLLALGTWSEEAQEHHLMILDLTVSHSGGAVAGQPAMMRLAAFQHPSRVAAVQACSLGGGEVVLVTAGADGGLARLQMTVPLAPGSQPDAIQLQGEDLDGAALQPWLDPHPGPATALDINADQREVVSASGRGTLAVSSLAVEGGEASGAFYDCSGALTFTCCRWATPNTFVTGTEQGLLQLWDRRQPGGAAQEGRAPSGHTLACLSVHPAQPHVVASGGSAAGSSSSSASGSTTAAVLLWDLRQGVVPASALPAPGDGSAGSVRGLAFDAAADTAQLVYCTSGGVVGSVREGGGARVIYKEPSAAVEGLCLGSAGVVRELFAVTDQEALVFMAGVL